MIFNLEKNKLIKKLQTAKFNVGIIGLGYVGLPICARFVDANINVYGVDNDKKKVTSLKKEFHISKNKNLRDFKYFKHKKDQISSDYKILRKL